MGNLTTLDRALQWLGQASDPQDMIARLITATSTQIEKELGYSVLQASYTRTFNGNIGLRHLFVPDLPLVSVQSLTINGDAIPAGFFSNGTQKPGYYNDADCIALVGYVFCPGFQNITATYTAGRTTVPGDLEQAALDWMKVSWANQAQLGVGVDATNITAGTNKIDFGGNGSVTNVKLVPMPSKVYAVIRNYERVVQCSL